MKNMGALEMGLKEEELAPIVAAWREASPNIVAFWWRIDETAKDCIINRATVETDGYTFRYEHGCMTIELPSGRKLVYAQPRIGENRFGGESITYMGKSLTSSWERLESYGCKLVENITQANARDILCNAIKNLEDRRIVMHVHDELIIEADPDDSLEEVCEKMADTPDWADGLLLRADGYSCPFYQKD